MAIHVTDTLADLSLLLIHDHTDQTAPAVREYLLSAGRSCRIADNVDDGLMLFEDDLPDLVCIDLATHQHACSLTRQLTERSGYRVQVVLLGGPDDSQAWQDALHAGAAAYLPDPSNLQELSATLERLHCRLSAWCAAAPDLLETTRTTRLLDNLPWGILLISPSEQLVYSNRAAINLTGLTSGQGMPPRLDDLFLLLYGVNRDANMVLLRAAMHGGTTWNDTIYCGQHSSTLQLELVPLQPGEVSSGYRILTLLNIAKSPLAHPYQTMLSATAFDLLFANKGSRRNQIFLASAVIEGLLPTAEPFALEPLLQELLQQQSTMVDLKLDLTSQIMHDRFVGQGGLLREILDALLTWAAGTAVNTQCSLTVVPQGREGDRRCLRFALTSVDRRLSRTTYQRGDELVAQQIAHHGITAFKRLRGLGLATTLASLLGSTLIVKSIAREGRTALFDLWLQQHTADAAVTPSPYQQPERTTLWESAQMTRDETRPCTILVAEDNILEQANIKNQMQRLGLQVVIVGNGREAVEECEQNRFDLIMMDILMPVMDGFEAVRLIREQERLQGYRTPIIALTSYSLQAIQERCARAGMNGYLAKPVTQAKLEQLLTTFASPAPPSSAATQPGTRDNRADHPSPLNSDQAMTDLGINLSFYHEMLILFDAHGKPLLDQIVQTLQKGEAGSELSRDAHKLKGMAGTIGAEQLAAICQRLQDEAEGMDMDRCAAYLQELTQARDRLTAHLAHLDHAPCEDMQTTEP